MSPKCPECGSKEVFILTYQEPSPEKRETHKKGETVCLGCSPYGDIRSYECKKCGLQFD